jgi:hypothetical protein
MIGCNRSSVRLWALTYGIIDQRRPYDYGLPSGRKLRQLSAVHTDIELANRFGCSETTVKNHRHQAGIFRSRIRRRYHLNEDFFAKINTEKKAYVLGLLSADGTINTRSVWLMLHAKDEHILHEVCEAMGSNARIFERTFPDRADWGPYKFVYFGSQKLVSDLASHGVGRRKSLTLQFPKLPKKLERHYLRGLFDGDGCIRERSFDFLGTEHVVDGVIASIRSHTGISLTKCRADLLWRAVGCRGSTKVLCWLYDGATIKLDRKHQRFIDYWR